MHLAPSTPLSRKGIRNGFIAIAVIIMLEIVLMSSSNNSSSSNIGGALPPTTTTTNISNSTGVSQSAANGESAVVARYHLSASASGTVAQDAAYLYSMESSDKYGAVLRQAGVGSLDDTADVLAHVVKAWNVPDADVSHSLDVIFTGLTSSSISWSDYTNTLIANGPKMDAYTSLADGAATLSAEQASVDTSAAVEIFNTIGDALAEPGSQLNIAMGGSGSIRALVKQGGLIAAIEKISRAVSNGQ